MTKNTKNKPKLPVAQLGILAVARFAEPVAYTSISPYLPEMIRGFGVAEDEIAKWAGLVSATFSLSQSITAVAWGKASDYWGRKPALIFGLLTNMCCFIIWGLSTSLGMAIVVRAIQGGSSGNVGIIRTMVAEMVPEKSLQPRAFSVMPLVWSLGSVVGPAFGGFLAQPAKQFPGLFGDVELFKRFPYLLPNLVATVFFLASLISAVLFLKETLASKKKSRDWGLLVGDRLKNAISRKPKAAAQRRRSFVDGEATAPLVPSTSLPRQSVSQNSSKTADVFTRQTIINLVSYTFLAFHSVAYDQNITVFLDYPVKERTKDNYKLPFYFTGGFGMSSGEIGTIFAIYGVTAGLVQFILYPPLVSRYGILYSFRACSIVLPIVYLITPYTSLFPTAQGRFIALLVVMMVKAVAIIVAFPSTTILLTNSCSSLRVLGTLNGYATMFSGLGRALGPASTGAVFTWGASHGYIVAAYFFLAAIAAIGAVPSFFIIEENGPTASTDTSDTEQEEGIQDSGIFLPNESAIGDDSDEETPSASEPLLRRHDGDVLKYQSITLGSK